MKILQLAIWFSVILNYSGNLFGASEFTPIEDRFSVPEVVNGGYGEYILIDDTNKQLNPISKDDFNHAYEIIQSKLYQPFTGISVQNIINKELAETFQSENIRVLFVPRTLYDLVLVRKLIEEDISRGKGCKKLNSRYQRGKIEEDCWHIDGDSFEGNSFSEQALEIAYRVNLEFTNKYGDFFQGDVTTYAGIIEMSTIELLWLRELHQNVKDGSIQYKGDATYPGPATCFTSDVHRINCHPLGITNDEEMNILLNSIKLECSNEAQGSVIVYRGASERDSVSRCEQPYSLSLGSSPLAGSVYDAGATAFSYMRPSSNQAYAIMISVEDLENSPFYFPKTSAVMQMYGYGEFFHSRTKAWEGSPIENGIHHYFEPEEKFHLENSQLEKDSFIDCFQQYYLNRILLK